MKKIVYKKLIRDRIPEIIQSNNAVCKTRVMSKKEFLFEVKKKMLEEAKELCKAKSKDDVMNELSDISELTDTLLREYNFSRSELKTQQTAKRKKRGGFTKRLFLEYSEK